MMGIFRASGDTLKVLCPQGGLLEGFAETPHKRVLQDAREDARREYCRPAFVVDCGA